MLMPKPAYDITDCSPVVARGIAYTDYQLNQILAGPVKNILQDTTGIEQLREFLADSVATTDFEQQELAALLVNNTLPESWRVGEAIAEVHIIEQEQCSFPWPTSRDLKNSNASPAGADLTGFQKVDDSDAPYRFAFGEVKTSNEKKCPPQLMYGRTGLKKQLEDLRDSKSVKNDLSRYLGHHAINASWNLMYRSAVQRYLRSNLTDIAIFGVLIRDVEVNPADLLNRAKKLAVNCPDKTSIVLYALYLPSGTISILSDKAVAAIQSGGAT